MDLYPAIDLRGGKVVQLVQGDFDREAVHGDDPVEVALGFEAAGVAWIHMVDLDAARTGEAHNRDLIARVCEAVSIPVQAGGGVRSVDAARALADVGVARVVMGTAAVEHPELVEQVASAQPVALGLDVRGREVSIKGWTEGAGLDIADALARLEVSGAEAVVVTQIQGEGLLGGPDLDGLAELLELTALDVIASGGVGELEHLRELVRIERDGRRLSGVIVGTAIYEGRVDVSEAVTALAAGPA
jgi:phosphoribosylformimino-5-aminoimidazole carboxamide ribotide isomerase